MKRRFCGITSWVSATGENLLMTAADTRPIVLITGAVGNLGRSLGEALHRDYRIVGLDLKAEGADFPVFAADFTSDAAVELALRKFRDAFGSRIASVIHLVAYFDFTGEDHALYQTVNVEGTRRLLRALQDFEVEQFVYASTMLVHSPCRPGERIDEHQPIDARWAYPKSKAAAEVVVRAEHKRIPYVILRPGGGLRRALDGADDGSANGADLRPRFPKPLLLREHAGRSGNASPRRHARSVPPGRRPPR